MERWTSIVSTVLALAVVAALVWVGIGGIQDPGKKSSRRGDRDAVPVEVATIEHGPIEHRRTFTGTLAPQAEFVVAPKVSGRVEQLDVDLADTVTRGQRVAKLDDEEYVQSVAQAEAEFAVATANLAEAKSLLNIAERELQRVERLSKRGVASESQRDAAKADQLAKQARVEVTRAEVARAKAALEAARIRLGYTNVTAGWQGGDDQRLVAERYLDEGETVAANAPLLRIVEMNPITAVFFVTERDYTLLRPGQAVTLRTDAHPGDTFEGRIARIAPVFRESTRQARVEVEVGNRDLRLKPGMFARTTVVLDRVEDATIVPEQALVRRDGRDGIFVISDDGLSVSWRDVQVGIRQDGRVQVTGDGLNTQVVT
ncbi:MAG: efflux RND transporter periplasmic adaptor subunit, partial [Acidiferrobacterales bacterium]|nr:efflux RND transporter periplasmic adaptor subunit [Acidiferrobacterales bacterium]